jgi:hypothetical protein
MTPPIHRAAGVTTPVALFLYGEPAARDGPPCADDAGRIFAMRHLQIYN